jgi:hypothetical protein
MGFLDKAKERASKLVETTKEKVDDMKDKRKADDLLEELGRLCYRGRTGRAEADDEVAMAKLVADLQALEAEGTEGILANKAESPLADVSTDTPPPPPPPPPAPSAGSDVPPSYPTPQ